ncbi:MAG: tripartite tricarboxylate transporter substrate binding protein [Burkholderiales bacterium]|nr:tripartite tricarboxylate transporter substrate binding protein [Burkholderiales bacterium]
MKFLASGLTLAAAVVLGVAPPPAHAQGAQPIKIIIGFTPGGILDTLARVMAEKLRVSLDSAVIVENRPGAATMVAMDVVKKSPPDGRSILLNTPSPFTIFPYTYPKLDYDPERDFVPVSQLVTYPLAFSTGANSPYKNFDEYRRWVKAESGRGKVGVPGLGSTAHFAILELGKALAVTDMIAVAYKGSVPLVADEMGGHIPAGMDSFGSKLQQYRKGNVTLLAITGKARSRLAPEVPTFGEVGVKGLDFPPGWYGAFVRAGTPAQEVEKLGRAMNDAIRDPQVRKLLETHGVEVVGSSSAELKAIMEAELKFWKPVVAASGFVVQQ